MIPFDRFGDFIDPAKDRFIELDRILTALHFHYSIVKLGTSRYFLVSSRTKKQPQKVFVAHYDSVAGSPGANDNASSIFLLISVALRLSQNPDIPWLLIFTDNEERAGSLGIRSQGSYLLGLALKNTNLARAGFYVFDSCGCGKTLVISTITDHLVKNETGSAVASLQKRLSDLRNTALRAASRSSQHSCMLLPTPFSDDAGFLRAGLAAQTITTLPAHEAGAFASLVRNNPAYIRALVNREEQEQLDMSVLPATWQTLNSPLDTQDKLTKDTLPALVKFALALLR